MSWTCPKCERRFRRQGQGHECAPAMSLEEYFSTGPPHERPVFEAVIECLEAVGPVHVEPVSVGIFLKRAQMFAQLRPMTQWVAVSFWLPRQEQHERIVRKVELHNGRYWHVANVRSPDDFDERLCSWLVEAFLNSPD